ncbi:MAG: DUF2141 domain-containing protein [Myxococcales bacterium]|nr:DUF2141 domain-containing protein [Myxococcales bacterium]
MRRALLLGTPLALLLVAPLALGQLPPPPSQATVIATVVGLRNNNGLLDFGLYQSNYWLQDRGRLVRCRVRITNRTATCAMNVPAAGTYAIAFGHDENTNGRVDQGFLGIPLEGYGFSNDARPVLSPPSFEACRFAHRGNGAVSVRMTAQY